MNENDDSGLSSDRSFDEKRPRQTQTRGVAAIFGIWPGDESDEELLAALAELRRVRAGSPPISEM